MRLFAYVLLALLTSSCHIWGERVMRVGDVSDPMQTIAVKGDSRAYFLHKPVLPAPKDGWPVVFSFHGFGEMPEWQESLTRMGAIADRENFLLVVPEGLKRQWQDARAPKNDVSLDLDFFDRLLQEIKAAHSVDARRIYVMGMSNGGSFVQRLTCERSAAIAGTVVVVANLPEILAKRCEQKDKVPILFFIGEQDPISPFKGGLVKGMLGVWGTFLSSNDSVAYWAKNNGCEEPPVTTMLGDTDDKAIKVWYDKSCAGFEVGRYLFPNSGHVWPGGPQYLPAFMIGNKSAIVNGSQEIWDFFKGHKKP